MVKTMNSNKQPTALVMAGGTGGHVFPALATAEILQQEGVHVEWLGSRAGMEADLIKPTGIPFHGIEVKGLRGKGRLSLLLAPFKLLLALWQAMQVVRRVKPDVVLGMGGFASGPGGLAAWLLGKPLVIHEQNAVAGMTNKSLARFAYRVLEAFKGAFPAGVDTHEVGNPVRGDILQLTDPEQRLADREGPVRLLVVGGSLGAKAINERLPEALVAIPADQRPDVWHQTGKRNIDLTRKKYAELGLEDVKVVPFIEKMDEAFAWADLVLCRAGALTVSEISIAGVASVLVPFPYAVDDHQTMNARYLADMGAAELVDQTDLSKEKLIQLLTDTLSGRDVLRDMAVKARALGKPDAGKQVADVCLEAIG